MKICHFLQSGGVGSVNLNKIIANIHAIIYSKDFQNELSRFIPLEIQERTLKKEKFKDFLINETKQLIYDVKKIFDGEIQKEDFYI